MTSALYIELLESVYTFLMSNGHEVTARSLAKEAKLDEKKLKNRKPFDLMDLYPSSLK
jgi:LisH